ncbi:unnamed protein product [Bursaphelenchus xylophilus]|uniref:(pine wood nematode) hypothetical protein n=1 Tax=Bursaphelenchus xylophilus TaxID=6326 RepID=A0A1I7SLS9_BURXY|nr:unnamed protein product [Bursaphelenchus xylophilus]CAG9129814.1 unnamed protein product [Bursaphelenchus xylophilus]
MRAFSQPSGVEWIVDGEETALLSHHYQICDVLEKGPICTVYRATQRNTSKTFTIKSLDLRRYTAASGLTAEVVEKEVEICASLKHHYFCQLRDVISGLNALHMIFEHVEGADICFEIVKRASAGFIYSETVASHYIKQLTEALHYMHSQFIVHRDIRPHNILLANKENNAPLKLRGFGIAWKLADQDDKCPAGQIGIPQFMAPEVVDNKPYGREADMWSLGVLICVLLSGRLPFTGPKDQLFDRIRIADFSLKSGSWKKISDPAKDLVKGLLTVDPRKRLTAEDVLEHPWVQDRSIPPRIHLGETVESIRKYNHRRKLKSNIIAAVNNPKWNRFPVHSFLSADSMPGGDVCDSDCTRRGPNDQTAGSDMAGVEKILTSLDKMTVLTDQSLDTCTAIEEQQLRHAMNDSELHDILNLYDRIRNRGIRPEPLNHNLSQHLNDIRNEINGLLNPSSEALELAQILSNASFQAIVQSHDIAVEEVFASVPMECSLIQSTSTKTPNFNVAASEQHISTLSYQTGNSLSGQLANGHLVQMCSQMQIDQAATSTCPPSKVPETNLPGPSSSASTTSMHRGLAIDHQEPGTSKTDPSQAFYDDDDDDLILNAVSRVRLVQFQKDTEEPMGITLKITEDGRCLVARIMHGGMIHRQGTLHVFDEIREINGMPVANQSVDALQQMLREARGHVTFKIVPSYRSAPPACEIYVRAQFDYDPTQDDLIPCSEAGVPFKTGDILQVISKDDHNWWQARYVHAFPGLGSAQSHLQASTSTIGNHVSSRSPQSPTSSTPVAGLIPSPELQEWRTACLAMERAKDNHTCMWFNKKKKYYTTKYLRKHSDLFEQVDLVTYEEVVRLSTFRRKTLVLLGAHGVGRRHIKNTLIHRHPNRFAYPIPHTTRPPRKDEIDGKHYYFVSNDAMLSDIAANEYLEYGTHEECMYGTKLETIRNIHRTGKMAILDVEPQALKTLRTAEYAPFVVFIGAPDLHGLQDPDGSLERLVKESEILRQAFGHLFDYVICNNDIDDTIRQLELVVEKLSAIPQWVPISWVY